MSQEMTSTRDYSELRVLVPTDVVLGGVATSAFNALLRAGCVVGSISESDFIPLSYHSFFMRAAAKALRPLGVREFNRALLQLTLSLKPHLFLAVKGRFIQAGTLRAMRVSGARLYNFFPDLSFTAFGPYLPQAAREYDWIFFSKSFGPKDLKTSLGVERSSYLMHAYGPEIHRPRQLSREDLAAYGCEVSFIGRWSPKKAAILEELARRRPNLKLKVWGDAWQNLAPQSPLRKFAVFRGVFGMQFPVAICASTINLGLLQEAIPGSSSGDEITMRTFEIPACGGSMLHERTRDLLAIYREDESCVCFEGIDELVGKIDLLLKYEPRRRAIAERGRAVVEQAHSWDHRARTIMDHYFAARPTPS
jgi:glycosyltransferase involved in cell wall biosynthesis